VMGFIDKFYEHTPGFQVWRHTTHNVEPIIAQHFRDGVQTHFSRNSL
jgi:hypothetical protein